MQSETLYLADEAATEAFGLRLALATSNLQAPPTETSTESGTPGGSSAVNDSPVGNSAAGGTPGGHSTVDGTLGGRIFLHGELGAGKTTLVRGLMRGYGYSGAVKSPTYTLVEPYEFSRYNIYHFDLYRLSDPEEVEFLGVAEYLDPANLCLIEWPERGSALLPAADIVISLGLESQGRTLTWAADSAHGRLIATRLLAFGRQV